MVLTLLFYSSYQIWAILAFLVIINQLWSITEKLWIKVLYFFSSFVDISLIGHLQTWGEAYGQDAVPTLYAFRSFAMIGHEVPMDGYSMHHQLSSTPFVRGLFDIDWPSASQHPLFYIGVYAAIGLANALCNILSVTAQYTGALRASRILFKWVGYLVVSQYIVNLYSLGSFWSLLSGLPSDSTILLLRVSGIQSLYREDHLIRFQTEGRMLNRFGKVRLNC